MSDLDIDQLIDAIIQQGLKEALFSPDEVVHVRRKLASLKPDELLKEYLPRWYGSLYKWQPVSVEEWLFDEEHMDLQDQIWPVLANDLIELLEGGYQEAILSGGIGYGKSFLTAVVICRMLYELSCYKDPQLALGLASNSQIVIPNIATKEKIAKEVVFEYVAGFVRRSPYFRRYFAPDKDLVGELVFPNKIRVLPAASTQGSVIGQNIYSAVIDEANFLFKGASERAGAVDQSFDLAKVLYNAIKRRMESRFGKNSGILMIVSSAQYPDDFTEARYQEALEAGERVFYRRYSQWTPKPIYRNFDKDPKQYFWLSLGDGAHRPRLIRTPEERHYDPGLDDLKQLRSEEVPLLKVPEDFRLQFERDLDMAIRDIAGYATAAKHPFFRNIQPLLDSFERGKARGLSHPWSAEQATLADGSTWVKDALTWDDRQLHHFVHIDLALTQDAAGIAVMRLDGVEEHVFERPYFDELNSVLRFERDVTYVPKLTCVLLLRVVAPPQGEIPIASLRRIVLDLIDWGYLITRVTLDQWQSAETIQALRSMGVEADTLSVDRTMDAYHSFKEALDEDRLDLYEYPWLLKECRELERDLRKKKVDHVPSGSKDVSDAVAGAVHNCALWVRANPTVVVKGDLIDGEPQNPSPVAFSEFDDDEIEDLSWLYG